MAQEIDNNLLDLWLHADQLPVPVIRAMIEELNERRRYLHGRTNDNGVVTFRFKPTPQEALEYPLLEIMRHGRVS